MKTSAEIIARIQEIERLDWMGVISGELIDWLTFEEAKPWLQDTCTPEIFAEMTSKRLEPLAAIRKYLPFAWGKANSSRGLSAGRSLDHLSAWLWLAGFGYAVDKHWAGYTHYGKKQLVIASVLTDFDWRKHDNGRWANDEESKGLSNAHRDAEIANAEAIAREAVKQ